MFKKKTYRNSYGIALFNKTETGTLQLLTIKKRNSYEFINFVRGKYNHTDDSQLLYMFANMKMCEKLMIATLNFEHIYLNAFLKIPREGDLVNAINKYIPKKYRTIYKQREHSPIKLNSYLRKRTYFERSFLNDGGERLLRLINQTSSCDSICELPSGSKEYNSEPDIDCAIREFREETGIFTQFKFLHNIRRIRMVRNTPRVQYINHYYVCYTDCNIRPNIKTYNPDQILEVESISWHTLHELKILNTNYNLYDTFAPIFRAVRNTLRKM